jgi:hypothetical protein
MCLSRTLTVEQRLTSRSGALNSCTGCRNRPIALHGHSCSNCRIEWLASFIACVAHILQSVAKRLHSHCAHVHITPATHRHSQAAKAVRLCVQVSVAMVASAELSATLIAPVLFPSAPLDATAARNQRFIPQQMARAAVADAFLLLLCDAALRTAMSHSKQTPLTSALQDADTILSILVAMLPPDLLDAQPSEQSAMRRKLQRSTATAPPQPPRQDNAASVPPQEPVQEFLSIFDLGSAAGRTPPWLPVSRSRAAHGYRGSHGRTASQLPPWNVTQIRQVLSSTEKAESRNLSQVRLPEDLFAVLHAVAEAAALVAAAVLARNGEQNGAQVVAGVAALGSVATGEWNTNVAALGAGSISIESFRCMPSIHVQKIACICGCYVALVRRPLPHRPEHA